jgi:hypothetical protein
MLKQVAAIALLSLVALPANAGSLVFVKDSDGALYSRGGVSGATQTAQYSGGLKSSSVTANGCGVIKVSAKKLEGTSGILIDEVTKTLPATITTITDKNFPCDGTTAKITTITKTTGNIYFPGFVPNSDHQLKLPAASNLNRTITANDCGIAKFSNTESYPVDKILNIDGQTITVASLSVGNPPLCKNKVLYLPQS